LGVGTITGFLSVVLIHYLKHRVNKSGVIDTHGTIFAFMIPGVLASIISAVVQATNPPSIIFFTSSTTQIIYETNRSGERNNIQQGGFQIVGMLISIGIAIVAGISSGIFMRIFNKNQPENQFIDESYF
jgi:hypothetical protein